MSKENKVQFKLDKKTLMIAVASLALVVAVLAYQHSQKKEGVTLTIGDKEISATIEN